MPTPARALPSHPTEALSIGPPRGVHPVLRQPGTRTTPLFADAVPISFFRAGPATGHRRLPLLLHWRMLRQRARAYAPACRKVQAHVHAERAPEAEAVR